MPAAGDVSWQIVPTSEAHFRSLHHALDIVAREKTYLAFVRAPPFEESLSFYSSIIRRGLIQFLAVREADVVGWCDILPVTGEARAHVGVLGIGLVPEVRHQGLGGRLMSTAIACAWERGLTRIELSVRADNHRAKALYARLGFQLEGFHRNAFYVDGIYHDTCAMALLR